MKIALVTGSSYGLGEAVSSMLLDNGYKVYGISRSKPKIKGDNFIWVKADLYKTNVEQDIAKQIKEGVIDVLVNNAATAVVKKTSEYRDEDFDLTYNLNLKAPIKLSVALLERLQGGLILNISSTSDRYPDPGFGLYGSSKTALNLFFETMAAENPNIKVINFLPSFINTPLLKKIKYAYRVPENSCFSPSEVGKVINDIISKQDMIASGSRIMLTKNVPENGDYYPENLLVYDIFRKRLKEV